MELLTTPEQVKVTAIAGAWFVPNVQTIDKETGKYENVKPLAYYDNMLNVNVPIRTLTAEMIASAMVHGFTKDRVANLQALYKGLDRESVTNASTSDFLLTAPQEVMKLLKSEDFKKDALGQEYIMLKFRIPQATISA